MSDKNIRTTASIDNRVRRGEFHIAFDRQGTPGYLRALKVTLEVDMLPLDHKAPKELQAKYRVNMRQHPLYQELERYVLANPTTKKSS